MRCFKTSERRCQVSSGQMDGLWLREFRMGATDAGSPKKTREKVNGPWPQPLAIPTGWGPVVDRRCTEQEEKGQPESERVFSRRREQSTASTASKMRTEECPLDLATLRSSVTFVGAVFVVQWGGSQIGGGAECGVGGDETATGSRRKSSEKFAAERRWVGRKPGKGRNGSGGCEKLQ